MFKGYYRRRFAELLGNPLAPADGLGDEAVGAAVSRRRLAVPRGLSDYYAVAGRHRINQEYNRLLGIRRLYWEGDHLVFMEENQWVAVWGVSRADMPATNPVVWQASTDEPQKWFAEPYRLRQFIMAMWRWQQTGVQEDPESD